MKSKASILVSVTLLTVCTIPAEACGPYWWYPADYMLPRIWDASQRGTATSTQDLIFKDWQRLIGAMDVALEDIREVVNDYPYDKIAAIPDSRSQKNTFAKYLYENRRSDLVEYLKLAKNCEMARSKYNSRWYYPSANDGLVLTLEETGERSAAEARKGGRLASRYALQALRAMMTLQDYPGMDSLWLEAGPGMEDGIVKDMCLGYMARADFEMGRIDKAMSLYSSQGDLFSIAFCLKRMGKSGTDWDLIGSVARYRPDNAALPEMMQRWFIGKVQNSCSDRPYSERMKERLITPEEADRI